MLDLFNTPTSQNANYQEFFGSGVLLTPTVFNWVKPRGASMVRIMLIGAGAGGRTGGSAAGGRGGGSGAVTQWLGPAMFIPDVLRVSVGAGGAADAAGGNTTIIYQQKNDTGYTLLTANGAASDTAGAASAATSFSASGLYSSIAGQDGDNQEVSITASTTTFLSAGAGGSGSLGTAGPTVAVNYGYPTSVAATAGTSNPGQDGFFFTQPVMVGRGGGGGATTLAAGGNGGRGGIGCGGGGSGEDGVANSGGRGGDGAVYIWTW